MTGIFSVVGKELSIGRLRPCQIICGNVLEMSATHILISNRGEKEYISITGRNGAYLNGRFMTRGEVSNISYGDELELFGIRILWLCEYVAIESDEELIIGLKKLEFSEGCDFNEYKEVVVNNPYFSKVPRPRYSIENEVIELEAPPQRQMVTEQPMLMTIGPAFTMALPMTMGFLISRIASKSSGTISSAFMYTGVITAVISALLGVIFAVLNIKNRRKNILFCEERRRASYTEYVKRSESRIKERYRKNVSTLRMMYPEISEIIQGEFNRYLLWNKNPKDEDYLTVRLGRGDASCEININVPKDRFSVVEDELRYLPNKLREKYAIMRDVPITVDVLKHKCIGVISESPCAREEFFYELITAIAVAVAPNELKIACIFENESVAREAALAVRFLPHLSHNNKTLLTYGTFTNLKAQIINDILDEELYEKLIIFTDSYEKIVSRIHLNERCHIFVIDKEFENMPSECRFIIQNDTSFSGYIEMSDNSFVRKNVLFDKIDRSTVENTARALQAVRYKEKTGKFSMPDKISFYELFNKVIRAEDLINNWNLSSTKKSINAPLGISLDGEIISLDFHEKGMGPHGLIAGTTGSGKSEILQTIILSLSVMYSKNDVGFFLIDYKGGGMASLFEKLPHVMGSISNLSGQLIKRAMASVRGENERRQRIFAECCVNNISEYQEQFKLGRFTEPLPHIFIIIDEFAELKREEPEFMSGLVSVARVGRSLGIHLILATQKPSGVVDENIFSNSRFRICLRVQDKSDSMEMLHKPDAANIVKPGQGILQVGNDEIFINFQGAYTMDMSKDVSKKGQVIISDELGNEYIPSEVFKEESGALAQLYSVIDEINKADLCVSLKEVHPLWAEPLEEDIVYKERENETELIKYSPYDIGIGIYDNPYCQNQGEYIINIVNAGHHIILGTLQSGKSTLLSTISYALLSIAHNNLMMMYFIDFSLDSLKPYRNSLLTGGYINEENEEDIEKLFILLERIIDDRKKQLGGGNFRQYAASNNDEKMPAIFLFIDGIGAFRERTKGEYDKKLENILKNGESLGIYVIASANAISTQEMPRRLADSFKMIIPLQLRDKYEYKEALALQNMDFSTPEQIRGRGLCVISNKVLEFQVYKPVEASDDFERINVLNSKIEEINERLINAYTEETLNQMIKEIPAIPKHLTFKTFIDELNRRKAYDGLEKIPLGFYLRSGEICYLPDKEKLIIAISGRNGSGKKNLKRVIEEMQNYVNENIRQSYDDVNQKIHQDADYVNQIIPIIYDDKLPFDKLTEIKQQIGDDPYVIHLGGALDRQNLSDFSYIPYSKQTQVLPAGYGIIRKTLKGYEHGEIVIPLFEE